MTVSQRLNHLTCTADTHRDADQIWGELDLTLPKCVNGLMNVMNAFPAS